MAEIKDYYGRINECSTLYQLLAFEGLAAKAYFKAFFDNTDWNGRQPRVKVDPINSVLDIGYTLLFSFIEALLGAYGFDNFCGVYHRQFYMRKSLVCDLVEPFRPLIDKAVRKAFNLGQIKEEDFEIIQHQYRLKWKKNAEYISFLLAPIIEEKTAIFQYVQSYYRCFMKGTDCELYPFYRNGEVTNGNYKL